MTSWRIIEGDCRDSLASLDAGGVQACVTSPPYFGLRDYGLPPSAWADGWVGCLGLEPTPDMYVAHMVEVFTAVRHALADDGTVWLNLGDSYAGSWGAQSRGGPPSESKVKSISAVQIAAHPKGQTRTGSIPAGADYKPKDLIGIPWMVAFALRADGWYLRSDIIWAKPSPMPESVTDRPTKAHEYLFLLSKSARYYYDADAIREEASPATVERAASGNGRATHSSENKNRHRQGIDRAAASSTYFGRDFKADVEAGRNKRSVWTVATRPFPGAHFATFPPKLIEPCILAGCPEGGTVLDPFAGAGTTGMVALRHDRSFIGCELSPEYVRIARDRIIGDSPMLNTAAEMAA